MRMALSIIVAVALVLTGAGGALSGGDDGRAIVNNAIQAAGGEARLAKFQTATWKDAGTFYGMGEGLPYTSKGTFQRPDKFRMEIEGVFTMILNGDKGWIVAGGNTQEMKKDHAAAEKNNQRAEWIATLLPLKDKAFEIKSVGAAKVKDQPVSVVEVRRKEFPTVKLYFDKKTNLLVKFDYRTKAPDREFKEVIMENYYGDYRDVDGAKIAHKFVLNRDGKKYVEAEMSEIKGGAKLDAKTFEKPAE